MNWLHRPYPYENRLWRKALGALAIGAFVSLFLLVFQPFGLHGVPPEYYLRIFGGYGLVTFFGSLLPDALMPMLLPRVFREERWTVLTQILHVALVLVLIGAGNYFFSLYWGFIEPGWTVLLSFLWLTLLIGIIPVTFTVLLNQLYLLKRNLGEAGVLNRQIRDHERSITAEEWIELQGDNQDDVLKVQTYELLCMRAADNYVEVWYQQEETLRHQLMRSTLSMLEEQLTKHTSIVRCHRSYIVNLVRVQEVSGNAQGYRLQIHPDLEPVPVSRSQKGIVREWLAHSA